MKKSSIANKKKKEKKNLQPYLVYPIGLNGVGLLKVMMQGTFGHVQYQMLEHGHHFHQLKYKNS